MSNNKHTPGTWAYDQGITYFQKMGESLISYLVCDQHRRWVGAVFSEDGIGLDEAIANARLIAAAPETAAERDHLREVNAELLAAINGLLNYANLGAFVRADALKAARTAIAKAKAKGEAP